ncbi:MAG: flagellar export protein FliJ [Candidatus Velthaea sp.]
MKFKFRLDPVLDLRERVEDEKQRTLSTKQRDLIDAQAVCDSLENEREVHRSALTSGHQSLDAHALRVTYAHLDYLDREIEAQSERIAACAAEVERALAALSDASKDRKVLETLKVRRREAFDATVAQADQRELDDQNARQYGRAQLQRGTPS